MSPHVFLDKLPFNLSSKICRQDGYMDALETKDVKEFIRLLKEDMFVPINATAFETTQLMGKKIDELAGEALCGN